MGCVKRKEVLDPVIERMRQMVDAMREDAASGYAQGYSEGPEAIRHWADDWSRLVDDLKVDEE